MWIFAIVGVILLIWIGALVGYLAKGYFRPYQAHSSPIAASRRITFEQVRRDRGPLRIGAKWAVLSEI